MNAEVGFSISGGSVGSAMVWTDADGYAATSFNTTAAATVTASVSFAGLTGSGSVEVEGMPLTITTATLPPGTVGYDYTAVIQATGGEAPYNFVVNLQSGSLPFGYTLQNNGTLTGYGDSSTGSQQAGTYTFTVQVNDNAGRSVEKAFSLTLNTSETSSGPFFISTYLPDAMAGWHYVGRLLVGGSGELTFSAQGLPAWLQLSVDGTFSGTPPWDAVGTACQFWVEVQDDSYDPTSGTYRRASAMVSLGVIPHQAAQITVLGGNRQIAAGGAPLAQPLAVSISRPDTGAPLAGVVVMFNEFSVTTDADGVARVDWISPLQPGNFSIVVVAGEATATFSAYATHSGTASGGPPLSGTGNNFVPDAPTSQDMTSPHPVDHPLAEYRAVSVTTGKLSVNESANYYSWGTASNGTSSLSLIASSGWHGSRDGVKWRTSDPAHQQESPDDPIPALSELAWSSGLKAKAFNEKVPDGEVREVSEIDFDLTEGGGDATPLAWDYWDGGLFGRTEGVTRYASFEVRIKRAAGDDMQSVLTQSFLEVTTKKDSEGKETSTYTVRELSIEKDKNDSTENTSSPKTLLVTAEEGETKYLLPVEIKVYKKGTAAAPADGLVINTEDEVVFEFAGIPPVETLFKKAELVWHSSQLKHNGTWTEYKEEGTGRKIEKYTFAPGIYRVKLKIKEQAEIQFIRKSSDTGINPATGNPTVWGPAKVGQPDAFGVVLFDKQIALRNAAKAFVGTNTYDSTTGVTAQYGFNAVQGAPLCNIFVAHRGCESGSTVPAINHGSLGIANYPPVANQWAGVDDTNHSIPGIQTHINGWTGPDSTSNPQPGMIISYPADGGTGHCGIIDYDGQAISASTMNIITRNMSTSSGSVYRLFPE